VVADAVGDLVEEGEAQVIVVELGVGVVGFCPGDCEAAALEGCLANRLVLGILERSR
jgi:hypothetical protein